MTFYDWFIGLCVKNEKSVAEVVKDIGISSASASGWKYGSQPKSTTLFKLEQYFGESYHDAKSEQTDTVVDMLQELRDDVRGLLDVQKDMTPEQIETMKNFALFLKGQGKSND